MSPAICRWRQTTRGNGITPFRQQYGLVQPTANFRFWRILTVALSTAHPQKPILRSTAARRCGVPTPSRPLPARRLAERPPPPHPRVPGSNDYAHGDELVKELDQGAWPFLSTERQALYDWQKGLRASCMDDVRNANRRRNEDDAQKRASLLAAPGIRFCLGLRPLEEADSGRTPQGAPENLVDELYAEGEREDEDQKLQAALDDASGDLAHLIHDARG